MLNRATMLAVAATLTLGTSTAWADNAMKVCGAKYQAAKTAKTLPAGQTWNQFLAQCRASLTPATTTTTNKPADAPSAAQTAVRERQHRCGAQWKADKAAGKLPANQTWPQYWSACNKRLS